jgi:hypothetical protein
MVGGWQVDAPPAAAHRRGRQRCRSTAARAGHERAPRPGDGPVSPIVKQKGSGDYNDRRKSDMTGERAGGIPPHTNERSRGQVITICGVTLLAVGGVTASDEDCCGCADKVTPGSRTHRSDSSAALLSAGRHCPPTPMPKYKHSPSISETSSCAVVSASSARTTGESCEAAGAAAGAAASAALPSGSARRSSSPSPLEERVGLVAAEGGGCCCRAAASCALASCVLARPIRAC